MWPILASARSNNRHRMALFGRLPSVSDYAARILPSIGTERLGTRPNPKRPSRI